MSRADRFRRLADTKDVETPNPDKTEIINKILGADSTSELSNTDTEHTEVPVNMNTFTEQTPVSVTSKSIAENENVTVISNSNTEQSDVTVQSRMSGKARIPRPIEEFEKRLKKPTVEETHTRGTWLIRNDLLKRLEKLSRNQQRGFKTYVVNYALERILDELEGK